MLRCHKDEVVATLECRRCHLLVNSKTMSWEPKGVLPHGLYIHCIPHHFQFIDTKVASLFGFDMKVECTGGTKQLYNTFLNYINCSYTVGSHIYITW